MSPPEPDDAGSLESLLQVTLEGGEDDERAWEAIRALQARGTRDVLDAALQLLGASSAKARRRGADILGQLGAGTAAFRTERGDALVDLLGREREPAVLLSAGVALSHLVEPRALAALIAQARHPSAEARYGAAHGLAVLDAPEAVEALIQLSSDEDRDVRDWATFGLGTLMEARDTPRLRDALVARLGDEDPEIVGEALVGLATRKDPRAVEPVRAALMGETVMVYALEAAASLGDPGFHPLLLALRDATGPGDDYFRSVLEDVISQFEQTSA
ncbi:HEAT repeat domain-containing protein [Myxococcus sp. K38C18041901]|uniref:HEAT repeat domain-containing protein n=1 Tax=Myxococcus guangdongensis TaxID=2906760 RepID=UPI0020A71A21|nr:HEAT repeat domain-containing protein [Myxococcus guangdongensis]MCP3063691.1 HEAT repeat domain-containing protein [Myxococcus guangdongensis]